MEDNNTFEHLFREFLTPIINEVVDRAIARHMSKPVTPLQDMPELIGVKMTAELLHLSVPTIYGLVHTRSIPYYKRRQRLYFKRDEIEKWIACGRRMTVDEIQQAARESLLRGGRR